MKKLLVGGYFDERIFKGDDFDGKTPFNSDIDTYTLEQALELGFVDNDNMSDYVKDMYDKDFDSLEDTEKLELIAEYTSTDEIAQLILFETEEEAENYKQEVLIELEELEGEIEYSHKTQDQGGYYKSVYIRAPESRKAKLIATKGGSGSSTFRVTVPAAWIRKMGLGEDSRDLQLDFDGEQITIAKDEVE